MGVMSGLFSRWWFARGYLALRDGDDNRALEGFDRALRHQESKLIRACRAMVLMLLGRTDDARSEFLIVASSPPASNPNLEYTRLYAQMYLALIEDRLFEADQIAERLGRVDCRPFIRKLLIPVARPSLLAAKSMLKAMGIEGADPMGFFDPKSGVHWMKAVEAYANGDFGKAMSQISEAESLQASSPAQRALKAGLLTHLGRDDDADTLFDALVDELECAQGPEEKHVLLFCLHHRSATARGNGSECPDLRGELARETSLQHFLPIETIEPVGIRKHFENLWAGYQYELAKVTVANR